MIEQSRNPQQQPRIEPEFLRRFVSAVDELLDHYVDVDAPFSNDQERDVLESVERSLADARQLLRE